MTEPRISLQAPITRNARYVVRCACGFATDSAARSPEAAMTEVAARHRHHPERPLVAEAVDYTAHPLFAGRFQHEDRPRPTPRGAP